MLRTRVIPCLLVRNQQLVKTVKFKDPKYVGDPLNAVRIFNTKEVDELIVLDIEATTQRRGPPMKLLAEMAAECFMPLCYGGGIQTVQQVREILSSGIEKVAINSAVVEAPGLIGAAASEFGSQSIVGSMDVRQSLFGKYQVVTRSGSKVVSEDPVEYAKRLETLGVGEILVNAVHRDGTMSGYDLDLVRRVTQAVRVPVICCGGAGKIADFTAARRQAGASGVSAGSMFVFHGRHRAVLISYPSRADLERALD